MKKKLVFMVLIALLAIPMVSYAKTAQECASENSKSDAEVQKSVTLRSSENYQENNGETFMVALGEKLCCYDNGREIGRCHEMTPYLNVLNGECFSTRQACKENAGGYDFCFTCGSKCTK